MLLLIEPDQPVRQNPMSVGRAMVRRKVERRSLDTLTWELAPQYELDQVLPVALRRGIPTGRGLVVDEGFVFTVQAHEFLKASQEAQDELHSSLSTIPSTADAPGYAEREEKLRDLAEKSRSQNKTKYEEALEARNELLAEPIKEELQNHWTAATQRPVVQYRSEDGRPKQNIQPENEK